jgi:hypothetical protein
MFPKDELTKLGGQNFKYLALKMKFTKIPFGTATLKYYRTANTNSKVNIYSLSKKSKNLKI